MPNHIFDSNHVQVSKGIPRFTFDDLSPEIQQCLRHWSTEKKWMKCGQCGITRKDAILKKCGGCKGEWRIYTKYYCGENCQRQDWPQHKADCGRRTAEQIERVALNGFQVARAEFTTKYWLSWLDGLQPITMEKFFPDIKWNEEFLKITFRTKTETKSPLIPEKLEFLPLSRSRAQSNDLIHLRVEYDYYGGLAAAAGYRREKGYKTYASWQWKCLQWPWIFATFCAMAITNEDIAAVKLDHFLGQMKVFFEDKNHPISEFTFTKTMGKGKEWYLHPDEFEEWQGYVGGVIAY